MVLLWVKHLQQSCRGVAAVAGAAHLVNLIQQQQGVPDPCAPQTLQAVDT